MNKEKIIHLTILTGAGGGHKSATLATIEAIDRYYPNKYEHQIIDIMELLNPAIRKIIANVYETVTIKSQNTYRAFFELTDKTRMPANIDKRIYRLVKKDLAKKIDKKTRLVISYYPFFTYSIAAYLKESEMNIPFVTQITDTGEVHSAWMSNLFDYYLALTEETKFWLQERGVEEERIRVFGFPLREGFYQKHDAAKVRKKLGVGKEPLIFYLNSYWTLGDVGERVRLLDDELEGVTLYVVCGRNEKLKKDLDSANYKNKVIVVGFIDNVPEIMAASDLVISKAGGASTAEIIKMKKPSIISEVVPGQEEPNARFIESMGFGYIEKKPQDMAKRVKYVLQSNDLIRLKNNLLAYNVSEETDRQVADFVDGVVSKQKVQA
jgi:processive 1,2-diacylglycerol beta-glucosyltransferase